MLFQQPEALRPVQFRLECLKKRFISVLNAFQRAFTPAHFTIGWLTDPTQYIPCLYKQNTCLTYTNTNFLLWQNQNILSLLKMSDLLSQTKTLGSLTH